MNPHLLDTDVQQYILEQSESTISLEKIVLTTSPFLHVTSQELAQQINGRRKALRKFPDFAHTAGILYPPNVNLEQTSSKDTARYKASLIQGQTLIDLTGGFGIDSFYMSKSFSKTIHCEQDEFLSRIAAHNFKTLEERTIDCVSNDGLQTLASSSITPDWIYLDPSRKNADKKRVFLLEECTPDIVLHEKLLFAKGKRILLKTSPLLDITAGLKVLNNVLEIHILALKNDTKEVLWVLDASQQTPAKNIKIRAVNMKTSQSAVFTCTLAAIYEDVKSYGLPSGFLYEPNSAVLKAGAFAPIANQLGLTKLHQHTHLYTSEKILDFPGRVFKIRNVVKYGKTGVKSLQLSKANITIRNFPLSVSTLRKKWKIKEGGHDYLFFTTLVDSTKVIIHCLKVA